MSAPWSYYGTTGDVAALTPRYANEFGVFDNTTRPNLVTVTTLLTQVSAMVNSLLASEGFTTPVTVTTVTPTLNLFVEQEVAAIVEGINGSGRFGPTTKSGGGNGRFAIILSDVQAFITGNAYGLQLAGVPRASTASGTIGFRDTDNNGSETAPIFQREAFGNVFEDWDAD